MASKKQPTTKRTPRKAAAASSAAEVLALCQRVLTAHAELSVVDERPAAQRARAAYLARFEQRLAADPKGAVDEYDRWKRAQVDLRGLTGANALRDAWIGRALELYMKNQRAKGGYWPGVYESADRLLCAVKGIFPAKGAEYASAVRAMGEKVKANGRLALAHKAYAGKLHLGKGEQAAIIVMVALALGCGENIVKRAAQAYRRQKQLRGHADTIH